MAAAWESNPRAIIRPTIRGAAINSQGRRATVRGALAEWSFRRPNQGLDTRPCTPHAGTRDSASLRKVSQIHSACRLQHRSAFIGDKESSGTLGWSPELYMFLLAERDVRHTGCVGTVRRWLVALSCMNFVRGLAEHPGDLPGHTGIHVEGWRTALPSRETPRCSARTRKIEFRQRRRWRVR